MQVKKAIRKIAALATATGLVGATLAGAFAYTLDQYPHPFVDDTTHSLNPADSVIVVGAGAKTEDVLGAIEIAASLQAAAVTESELDLPGTVIEPSVTAGVKIERGSEKINYGDKLTSVKDTFDNDDLPDMLGDGQFEKEDYTQELTLGGSTGTFNFYSPGKVDKTEFDGADMLYLADDATVYTYTFDFDTPYTYDDSTDFESKTIEIQGSEYTITSVTLESTDNNVTKMELLAGDTSKWLQQDQPITIGDHTIMVVNVDDTGNKCGIEVDGTVKWVDVGNTETVGDVEIGVTDAIAVHSKEYDQDTCEVNVGAYKLELRDGTTVKVNDVEIEGTTLTWSYGTAGTWDGFSIAYALNDKDYPDNEYGPVQYLAAGQAWTDPVFGNFKLMFEGTSGTYEDVNFDASGDQAELVFTNTDGKEITVDFMDDGASHIDVGASTTDVWCYGTVCDAGQTVGSNDVYLWYVVSAGGDDGEVHVLSFDEFDDQTNELVFKDVFYNDAEERTDALSAIDGTIESVGIGSIGDILVGWDDSAGDLYFNATGVTASTENGMDVAFADGGNEVTVTLTSPAVDSDVQGSTADVFSVVLDSDATNDEVEVKAPTSSIGFAASGDAEYKDNNVQVYVSDKGATFTHDADQETSLDITYPQEDVYANIFIAPLSATASTSGSTDGTVMTEQVNKIPVGLAVLDSQAASMNKNMIVVGGPCVNDVANELEAPAGQCWDGYEEGKARIKYYPRNGKVALLVAGYGPEETMAASYVLRNYMDYAENLVGDEAEVSGTVSSTIEVTSISS